MAILWFTADTIGLKEEIERERREIEKQVPRALHYVGAEMVSDLQATLHREWYEKYKPTDYPRRTDDPSLGIPIGDDSNFDYSANGTALNFAFNPSWRHAKRTPWSDTPNQGIEWIQSKHGEIPARPFWNIFLEEQSSGGIIEKFIRGMSPYQVLAEAQDSNLDLAEFMLAVNYNDSDNGTGDWDDGDDALPF